MKIIISPAKKMNINNDVFAALDLPCFLQEAKQLAAWVRALTYQEAKTLWGCSDKIAELNFGRFQDMELEKNLTPALLSYEGIQYQYMAPNVFSREAWDYVQKNLRILSGFYGVLKPLDGVVPYRLEMQAKVRLGGKRNLYDFWGCKLYEQVIDQSRTIINLASKEYSKCVEPYLQPEDRFITCVFGEWKGGNVIQKGTQAKMARGEMVRFMAENQIAEPEALRMFSHPHYRFEDELSSKKEYVFLKSV